MRRDVQNRTVLITGASRGIGRRVAERIAACGAKTAVTARSVDELASLKNQLSAAGQTIEIFPGDLTNPQSREKLVADVVAKFGGLDVLMNCAGVCSFGEFATSSEAINRQVMEINFFAAIELTRLCVPHLMRSHQGGYPAAMLNLASICGRAGIPSFTEHCGSKHALVGMTEAWRGEFARFGIEVLLMLPGVVRSDDLNRHLLRNEGQIYLNFDGAQTAESAADDVVQSLLRNRTEETTGTVAWWVRFGKRIWPRGVLRVMHAKARKFARRGGLS